MPPETDFTILPSILTREHVETHGRRLAALTAIHEAGHFAARLKNGLVLLDVAIGTFDGDDEILGYCAASGDYIERDVADEVAFWGPAAETLAWAKIEANFDDGPITPTIAAHLTLLRAGANGGQSEIPASYGAHAIGVHLGAIEECWPSIIVVADALIRSGGRLTGDEARAAWDASTSADNPRHIAAS